MRLNISAWAIRKPIGPLILFVVLMVLGLVSFRSIAVTRMPNVDVPIVSVSITQSGAAPSELQTQVTKWVEDSISGVRGVKHITSAITEGSSVTTVEFRLEVNPDRAVNDVKDAVSRIRINLPRTIDEPVISRVEIAGLPILIYAVKAPAMTPAELSWLVEDNIARTLQGVKGVGGVERVGGVAREMRVTLQPDRLLALGITAADVNRQLRLTSADMSADVRRSWRLTSAAVIPSASSRSGCSVTRISRATPPTRSTPPTPFTPCKVRAILSSTSHDNSAGVIAGAFTA